MVVLAAASASAAVPMAASPAPERDGPGARVLVFTATRGWRHDSIGQAVETLRGLAGEAGLRFAHTEDPARFTAAELARYRAVVFANTTGDVLDEAQQAALQQFVRAGGGFMGVHSAADTEHGWPWYGELVGAWFESHPPGLQTARVRFVDPPGAADGTWRVTDEFYNFKRDPRDRVRLIATLASGDYEGGTMGVDHPIAWCREFDGGRSWYTGLGHAPGLYADPVFRAHLARGLRYAAGADDDC
ncbi:ThuA domain-containing protein [Luteimonas sp. RD2P54]|uniref:ThuA domain-containing protein n=1 Tax=Luteimonas endophytica TaxID=3042023 RepID=A0ABT6J6H7_9GAMM|nr:ThuA domain-containing protein [Luteimonas endophytica]MDH5822423.1 ThuA domain-containing protein [Luteimonas endophytica]